MLAAFGNTARKLVRQVDKKVVSELPVGLRLTRFFDSYRFTPSTDGPDIIFADSKYGPGLQHSNLWSRDKGECPIADLDKLLPKGAHLVCFKGMNSDGRERHLILERRSEKETGQVELDAKNVPDWVNSVKVYGTFSTENDDGDMIKRQLAIVYRLRPKI